VFQPRIAYIGFHPGEEPQDSRNDCYANGEWDCPDPGRKIDRGVRGGIPPLAQSSTDGIVVHQQGIIQFINKAGMKILVPWEISQVVGKPVIDFVHPVYREIIKQRIENIIGGGEVPRIREKFIRTDGSYIDVDVVAVPFSFKGKPAVMVIFTKELHHGSCNQSGS
jgi:PAS domain S-box-containing protein